MISSHSWNKTSFLKLHFLFLSLNKCLFLLSFGNIFSFSIFSLVVSFVASSFSTCLCFVSYQYVFSWLCLCSHHTLICCGTHLIFCWWSSIFGGKHHWVRSLMRWEEISKEESDVSHWTRQSPFVGIRRPASCIITDWRKLFQPSKCAILQISIETQHWIQRKQLSAENEKNLFVSFWKYRPLTLLGNSCTQKVDTSWSGTRYRRLPLLVTLLVTTKLKRALIS